MIKTIIKRDGRTEAFQPSKLNQWGEWAAKSLGESVDWPSVVLDAVSGLSEECSSTFLQERLIKVCLDLDTWSYNRMAGRLYASLIHKNVFGAALPTVLAQHRKLQALGYMEPMDYSDEEYALVETLIDHELDFTYTHFQLHTHLTKYAVADRVKGVHYESSQFLYMRMAMALMVDQPRDRRMTDVAKFYEHLSHNRINAPTPNNVNLGTPLRGYASCCLYATDDNARSIAIGNHIANTMTYMSAGIGSYMQIRSLNDPVRGGSIRHLGKLGYYRAVVGEVKASLQNGRGGACTSYFSIFDPEIDTLLRLKNPMSTEDKKIRGMDYSWGGNRFFAKKVAKNEEIFLFNTFTAPDLYKALYSDDEALFDTLYQKYENDPSFTKTYVNARDLLITAINEWNETGRIYEHNLYEANHHTPFKDTIYSSNLCVAPETLVLTDKGAHPIASLVDQAVTVWNGEEWSGVTIRKTGEQQELLTVILTDGRSLTCTPYHKWYIQDPNGQVVEVQAGKLREGSRLIDWISPMTDTRIEGGAIDRIEMNGRKDDTYCFSEPKRHMGVFNGILTGQCQEVYLPTEPYQYMLDLYSETDTGAPGEVATCNLGGIVVSNIESEAQYEEVAYYVLLMIDKCIHLAQYELPHIGVTSKARLNAGVGILGLAHLMAKEHQRYTTVEGKRFIHEVAERHYYYLLKASLKLGQELGNAPWMHKTKWPEGWLPLDTYNPNVDKIAAFTPRYDWESLRAEIIANGGIRNSVLAAHMPTETSANASGTTNGLYPVRELTLIKTDNQRVNYWAAPDGDTLGEWYQSAWDVPTEDMTELYAIVQKWTDQGISADFYRRVTDGAFIGSSEMIKHYLHRVKLGLKGKYYMNQKTSNGMKLVDGPVAQASMVVAVADDEADCEACKL